MNKDHYSDQLEQLIKDKDVNALTPAEQELVIRELGSLETYTRLRTIASRSQDAFAQEAIAPSGAVLGNILTRVTPPLPAPTTRTSWHMRSIPLYQVAAAMTLCVLSMRWWTSSRQTAFQDPVIITLVDTVIQEVVRVDTILMDAPSAPSSSVKSTKPRKQAHVVQTQIASNETRSPDYRFSRGDYPIGSAHRSGQSLREQSFTFALDSMPEMEHVFAVDKVF